MCSKYVSQKRNESIDKNQCYNILSPVIDICLPFPDFCENDYLRPLLGKAYAILARVPYAALQADILVQVPYVAHISVKLIF